MSKQCLLRFLCLNIKINACAAKHFKIFVLKYTIKKKIRIIYGNRTGNQLPVHLPLLLRRSVKYL